VTNAVDLRMAELLLARLCHDLVGPVGAISNGLEILNDEPEFAVDAGALISQSVQQAATRLQFYRIAYGSIQAIGDETTRDAAIAFFAHTKVRCHWATTAVPGGWQKLICNLLLLASEALLRGGDLRLDIEAGGQAVTVTAIGEGVRLAEGTAALLEGAVEAGDLTPRTVQAAFAGALARRLGVGIALSADRPNEVGLSVRIRE